MSGYLIFPFAYLDLFHPDWKAAAGVLNVELYFIRSYPLQCTATPFWHSSVPLIQGLETWFSCFIENRAFFDLVFIVLAIFSPLYWLFPYIRTRKINRQILLLWFIVFAGAWLNILTSTVFRFAACTMLLSILLPFFVWAQSPPPWKTGLNKFIVNGAILLLSLYYLVGGYTKLTTVKSPIAGCWLLPIRDKLYSDTANRASFPFMVTRPGIKIYVADSCHDCLNAGLPCIPHSYGEIEMRGSRIDQGFRIIRDTIEIPPRYLP